MSQFMGHRDTQHPREQQTGLQPAGHPLRQVFNETGEDIRYATAATVLGKRCPPQLAG